MKKGIIFDMDGTLWDSAPQVAKAWNLAMEACGYARSPLTTEDMYAVMGKTMIEIAEILFEHADERKRMELLEACCAKEEEYLGVHGGTLYPDVRQTLAALAKDYPLYIVSNCQRGYIEVFLDYYGLWEFITDKQCYGYNGLPKADNIRILCERNQLDEAVYVGDTKGDYDSSMKAGVKFIHAAYGFGTVAANVPRIRQFSDLMRVVPKVLE